MRLRRRPGAPRPLLLRLLPVLAAAPLLVVVSGGASWACSCAGQDLQQSREQADVVFAGEVLRREVTGRWGSADEATYVVRVDRVYKGEAAAVQEVVTVASGATCGLELPGSGPALLFGTTSPVDFPELQPAPGQVAATLCGGSRVGTQVPAGFGAGRPPVAGTVGAAPAAGPPSLPDGVGLPAIAGAAGVVVLAGAAGLMHLRARRRRLG